MEKKQRLVSQALSQTYIAFVPTESADPLTPYDSYAIFCEYEGFVQANRLANS